MRKNISLKVKLMLLLVSVASSILIIYALIALKHFEQDKMAYVYESNQSHVQNVSGHLDMEIGKHRDSLLKIVNTSLASQSGSGIENYLAPQSPYQQLWVYELPLKDFSAAMIMKLSKRKAKEVSIANQQMQRLHKEILEAEYSILPAEIDNQWYIAMKVSRKNHKDLFIVAQVVADSFLTPFNRVQPLNTYLVNHHFEPVITPSRPTHDLEKADLDHAIHKVFNQLRTSTGVFEVNVPSGEEWIMAVSRVGVTEFTAVSVIPKSVALSGVYILAAKSILFVVLLFFVTLSIGVISAHGFTAKIRALTKATNLVSEGNLDIRVDEGGGDEVGVLSKNFNSMTKKVKLLLEESAEKARMEEELKTAQLVQSTLFPKSEFDEGEVQIRGYYRPASECSGDWYHYHRRGNKTYMWIGDATGHGVPAALITSAAKSTSALFEKIEEMELSRLMALLNSAVHAAGGGQVNMTFFLACFDEDSGKLTYCNASHDPPYFFPCSQGVVDRNDMNPLIGVIGPRLGESQESAYTDCEIQLQRGDKIVFYTDGVTELYDKNERMWGERRFVKTVVQSFNEEKGIPFAMKQLDDAITNFRGEAPLHDDITYFIFGYNKNAS